MNRKIFVVAALVCSSRAGAQSGPEPSPADSSFQSLDAVVVTATKFPIKQHLTGKVLTVINRTELENSGGKSIGEILNTQAGIVVNGAQNTMGTNQEVYMRGGSSGKTLILLDGVPLYDPSTISTAYDLNFLSINQVERIEILRGSQSTLYGSDAVAGVINIISRGGSGKPVNGTAGFSAGSFGTFRANLGIYGKTGATGYNLQYQHQNSNGFSSAYDSTGTAGFDKDGFNQNSYRVITDTRLSNSMHLEFQGMYSGYDTDADGGAFTDDRDFTISNTNVLFGTGLRFARGKTNIRFRYHLNYLSRHYLDDSSSAPGFALFREEQYTGRSHSFEAWSHTDLSAKISLLAGADYRLQNTDQSFFSVSTFGPYASKLGNGNARMRLWAAYGSLLLQNDQGFNGEIGVRLNHHSNYGNNLTFSVNPSYIFSTTFRVFVNISSGFKAPSLYQLFDPSFGNTGLKAEKSLSYEGGMEWKLGKLFGRLVGFYRNTTNGIDFNYATYRYFNNNHQQDYGGEAEAGFRAGKFSAQVNYSYVTGRVNTLKYVYDPASSSYVVAGDTSFNNLLRRPRHAINLSAGIRATKRLYTSVSLRTVSKRLDYNGFDVPSITVDGYCTIGVYASYRIGNHLKIFADARNLTNQQFFDIRGFNSTPFNWMAGISWN